MNTPYRRLDPAKQEFRLLEVQAARTLEEPVECRLITARLTEDVDFIALSSLYGDREEIDRICLSGRSVAVPKHLVSALKHIRAVFFPTVSKRYQRKPARKPHGAPRWLRQLFGISSQKFEDESPRSLRIWMDLLCVNQRDEAEKSKQRTDMKAIYRSAELVVGWLGDKHPHTDVAMATLAEIEDAMPAKWGDPGDREKHPDDYAPTHRWAAGIAHIWTDAPKGMIPFQMPHWIGCNDFMERPYFQRRWILEEIAMAKYPTFLIGDNIVPWKQVLRLNRMMEEFKNHPSNVFPREYADLIADLPLETAHKLLDEFAKREALEEARLLKEGGKFASRGTSSTRSHDG